jgi:NADP-dependent 3-hydroxy acid dehydrogenase YdfG
MIATEGGDAVAVSYDVTNSAQCAAMVGDAVSRWGRLDCLDNNDCVAGHRQMGGALVPNTVARMCGVPVHEQLRC